MLGLMTWCRYKSFPICVCVCVCRTAFKVYTRSALYRVIRYIFSLSALLLHCIDTSMYATSSWTSVFAVDLFHLMSICFGLTLLHWISREAVGKVCCGRSVISIAAVAAHQHPCILIGYSTKYNSVTINKWRKHDTRHSNQIATDGNVAQWTSEWEREKKTPPQNTQ